MKKKLLFLIVSLLFVGSFTLLKAQTYVGSDACASCHPENFNEWKSSGHPYKFSVIENNQPPVYPDFVTNYEDQWMDSLGDGTHTWADIAGVIGGFGWKARFVGTDGHLIGTAGSSFSDAGMGHNQINFFGGVFYGWVDYDPGDVKMYNYGCFKCHTTGGDTAGTWLSNVPDLGSFNEGGVGCEACHGPGSQHIVDTLASSIDLIYEQVHLDNASGGLERYGVLQTPSNDSDDPNFLCGTCHNRGYTNKIDASGGFVKHHEQWDEFVSGPHYDAGFTCLTCHDQHKRVIWDGDGITKNCGMCHSKEVATKNHGDGANCIDCHMPFSDKSGTTRGQSGYKGDIRSHIFRITPNTESMFTEDGKWVRDDDAREASYSPAYSCLGCHNNDPDDDIPNMTLEEAAAKAKDMHEPTAVTEINDMVLGVYPNPTHGAAKINFNLSQSGDVSLDIFNTSGQLVYTLKEVNKSSGNQMIYWDGTSNTGANMGPGYYFVKVTSGSKTAVKKLVLMN